MPEPGAESLMTDYFLGDALGSLRQLTDSNGNLTLSKAYNPYGEVTQSAGAGQSSYGYTSEYQDGHNDLLYLRARHYAPAMGRFLSRDTWAGDYNRPGSLNRWAYVEGNVVNFVDPTGHIKQSESHRADGIYARLNALGIVIRKDWGVKYLYNYHMMFNNCMWQEGQWNIDELIWLEEATNDLKIKLGGPSKIRSAVGLASIVKVDVKKSPMAPPGSLNHLFGADIVFLGTYWEDYFKFTFIHEFGHVWDYRTGNHLSLGLMKTLGTWVCPDDTRDNYLDSRFCWYSLAAQGLDNDYEPILPELPPDVCLDPTNADCTKHPYPYSTSYGQAGAVFTGPGAEDWANALAYYVYPEYRQHQVIGLGKARRQYVKKQIGNLP